jgi:hypothetical protein
MTYNTEYKCYGNSYVVSIINERERARERAREREIERGECYFKAGHIFTIFI